MGLWQFLERDWCDRVEPDFGHASLGERDLISSRAVRVREYGGLSVPIDDPDLARPDFTILGFRSQAFSGHLAFMLRLTLGRLAQPKVWQRLAARGLLDCRPHVQRALIGEVEPLDTSRFVDAETLGIAFPLECDFASGLVMRVVVPRRAG